MKAILVSLRDADDPMVEQERRCFEETSGLARIDIVRASIELLCVFCATCGTTPWARRPSAKLRTS